MPAKKVTKPYIYIRATKSKIPCSKHLHDGFYNMTSAIRHKEQARGRCKCPQQCKYSCDGDCENCQYRLHDDTLSLDTLIANNSTQLHSETSLQSSAEDVVLIRCLLEQVTQRFRELDPDADTIIQYWMEDYTLSCRAIAKRLGRNPRTFSDQIKRFRAELRKILDN